MSLVVARRVGPMLCIVSDTFLTDPSRETPRSLLQGVIKTCVLTEELAISYAGSLSWVEAAFRQLGGMVAPTRDLAKAILLRIHSESARAAEFIVATSRPPELIQIKDGSATATASAWLGSFPAFERFQGYATGAIPAPHGIANSFTFEVQRIPEPADGEPPDPAAVQVFGTMVNSMKLVIGDGECPDVGGFVVPVGLHNGRFTFMDYAAVVTHPLRFDLLPKSFVVPFGTAAEGGHAINLMSDARSSTYGLALYALQGRCGAAFTPSDGLLRPTVIRDKSPIEFEEALADQLGLQMKTFYGQPAEYCQRAMKKLDAGDLPGALEQADLAVARSDKDPAGFDCRAIVLASMGRLREAIADFDRALAMNPGNFRAWANRGLARGRGGDVQGAMEDLSRAIDINSKYAFAYRMRARGWHALDNDTEAQRDETTAAQLDVEQPKGPDAPLSS